MYSKHSLGLFFKINQIPFLEFLLFVVCEVIKAFCYHCNIKQQRAREQKHLLTRLMHYIGDLKQILVLYDVAYDRVFRLG